MARGELERTDGTPPCGPGPRFVEHGDEVEALVRPEILT